MKGQTTKNKNTDLKNIHSNETFEMGKVLLIFKNI